MADPVGAAMEEMAKVLAGGLAASLIAWGAFKREKIRGWLRGRKAHREGLKTMVATWPTMSGLTDQITNLVANVETQNKNLNERMDRQDASLGDLLAMGHGQFELNDKPTFVCDNKGFNLLVNSAYARLLGVGRDDLMGFRYKNLMAEDSLAQFWAKFQSASVDHLEIDMPLWFHGPIRIHVCVRMVPHPRQMGPATHWVGTIVPCEEHE